MRDRNRADVIHLSCEERGRNVRKKRKKKKLFICVLVCRHAEIVSIGKKKKLKRADGDRGCI